MNPDEVKVKSLQKALEVLNCFTKKKSLGITEISEELGLYKSNVHNIISTFKAMEYLEQDAETGKYHLGSSVFALCRAVGDSYDITGIAIPYMQEIVKEINEIVYLAVPHEDEVIYLEAVYPTESVRPMRSLLGERAKMYCTSVGKAMMAQLPEEVIEEYASKELLPITAYTITDKERLKEELRITKERGYAFDNMEIEFGIKCIGVPLFNQKGGLEGALSISCPSLRLNKEKEKQYAQLLKGYGDKIQKKL